MNNLGFLAAIGAAICWGSYIVPFKKSRGANFWQYQAIMSAGIFLSGIIFSLIFGYPFKIIGFGILSGMLWAIPNAISLIAIADLGLARAVPVMSSLVVLSTFLWGVFFFKEMPSGFGLGLLAIALIIAGVAIVSLTENIKSQNVKKGLVAAVLAGVVWGSQLTPLKMSGLPINNLFFSVCLGIAVTGFLFVLLTKTKFNKKAIKEGLFSGIIWNIGNLLSLFSLSIIGLAKEGPISQVATLVAVLWGIFYFKEVTRKRHKVQVLAGATILLLGIFVLSQS